MTIILLYSILYSDVINSAGVSLSLSAGECKLLLVFYLFLQSDDKNTSDKISESHFWPITKILAQ